MYCMSGGAMWECFGEYVAFSVSLSLQLQTGRNTSVYSVTGGLRGAAAGWESNYRLWRVYKEHLGGGHCLYIIAGHSSGKTSDGCPQQRGAE